MPLKKAGPKASKATKQKIASANIAEMRHAGYPQKQAIAAGLQAAGLSKRKKR